jgi:hypothetical protein
MRIVMVSANAHEYSLGGAEYSHDAFVMKPIEMHSLLECMGSVLGATWTKEPPKPDIELDPVGILPSHSRHHIDDLYQLGQIGHVRGIQARLREIEAEDPSNKAFARHLQALVSNFDLKRYMTVLEAMRKSG